MHQQSSAFPLSRIPARYSRVETIATGATASVFHAHDLVSDRPVILLVVSPIKALVPAFVARFERESRLLASIDHPNIVRVVTFGTELGVLSFATEDRGGDDLERQIRVMGPLPPREAARLARQILSGLSALHGAGFLHLHLTPRRIVVDPAGTARLASHGLGVLRDEQDEILRYGTLETVRYLAPEQLQNDDVSESTDIYAVGVILFELITGETPFPGEHPSQVRMAQIQTPPPAPGGHTIAYVPPALDAVVLRALAKNPVERYGSAREMIDALVAIPWPEHTKPAAKPAQPASWSTTGTYETWPTGSTLPNGKTFGDFVPVANHVVHAPRKSRANWIGPLLVAGIAIALLIAVIAQTIGGGPGTSPGGAVAGVSLDPEESTTPTPRVIRAVEREPSPTATPKKKAKRTPTATSDADSN